METGDKQDRTRFGTSTRLELLKRQLHEWKTLLQNQKQVRHWIQNEQISLADTTGTKVRLSERIQQLNHLSLLSTRHVEERQQLYVRHQEEQTELDQVIAGHQPDLAND